MNTRSRLFRPRPRRGFAMFMALGALVIIGVLVAGSSYITLQETRLGQNSVVQTRAFAAAEYGLNKVQADWDRTPNLSMENATSFDTSYIVTGQGTAKVRITRLNNETFWLVSEGRASAGDATSAQRTAVKRVGAILRLRIPTIKANGALTSNGAPKIGGSTTVNGYNNTPSGWGGQCATAPTDDKAGIVVPPNMTPDLKSGSTTGDPAWTTDSLAADDNTYIRYGDETWTTLEAQAFPRDFSGSAINGIRPDTLDNGACDKSDVKNWGEPWRGAGTIPACQNYFPIVLLSCTPRPDPITHLPNCSVHVNGGRGQGILLMDGDAKLNGQFEWYGLIVVTGDVTQGGGGFKLQGALMARNADTDNTASTSTGNAQFMYSGCALERAMRGSAQVVQAKERAWAELYD